MEKLELGLPCFGTEPRLIRVSPFLRLVSALQAPRTCFANASQLLELIRHSGRLGKGITTSHRRHQTVQNALASGSKKARPILRCELPTCLRHIIGSFSQGQIL